MFCPYVRTYVRSSTIKRNGAKRLVVVWIDVDDLYTAIWILLSSNVKVTRPPKLRKWPFWKSIYSDVYEASPGLIIDYESMEQYLNSLRSDFWYWLWFSNNWTLKILFRATLYHLWRAISPRRNVTKTREWYRWKGHQMYFQKLQAEWPCPVSRARNVTSNLNHHKKIIFQKNSYWNNRIMYNFQSLCSPPFTERARVWL